MEAAFSFPLWSLSTQYQGLLDDLSSTDLTTARIVILTSYGTL